MQGNGGARTLNFNSIVLSLDPVFCGVSSLRESCLEWFNYRGLAGTSIGSLGILSSRPLRGMVEYQFMQGLLMASIPMRASA